MVAPSGRGDAPDTLLLHSLVIPSIKQESTGSTRHGPVLWSRGRRRRHSPGPVSAFWLRAMLRFWCRFAIVSCVMRDVVAQMLRARALTRHDEQGCLEERHARHS